MTSVVRSSSIGLRVSGWGKISRQAPNQLIAIGTTLGVDGFDIYQHSFVVSSDG
ncbi:MAG TPA: hypothetical protein VFW03_18100 [Gemmatimonadaceae bacterium]|nr:hypothetical protein [Gemmatimonadaceae bacterium]